MIGVRLFVQLIYGLFLLLPLYWLIALSLGFTPDPASAPAPSHAGTGLHHYASVLTTTAWIEGYLTALYQAVSSALLAVLIAVPTACGLMHARPGVRHAVLFLLLLAVMMPPAILLVPDLRPWSAFGAPDTGLAVAWEQALFNVPVATGLLTWALRRIPTRLMAMAAVDGFSTARCLLTVILPRLFGVLVAMLCLCFLLSWVAWLLTSHLTTDLPLPFAVRFAQQMGTAQTDPGLLAAAGVISLLPGLCVLWILRRLWCRGRLPLSPSSD